MTQLQDWLVILSVSALASAVLLSLYQLIHLIRTSIISRMRLRTLKPILSNMGKYSLNEERDLQESKNGSKLYYNGRIASLVLGLFLGSGIANAQDVAGNPLPNSIPQEIYERVVAEPNNLHPIYGAVNHWVASGHTVDVVYAELIDIRFELQAHILDGCAFVSDFKDGPEGKLWKPVADGKSTPVIVMPGEYFSTVQSVDILDFTADFFAGENQASVSKRPNVANGGRVNFDVTKSAGSLAKPTLVIFKRTSGERECYFVDDPTQRYD